MFTIYVEVEIHSDGKGGWDFLSFSPNVRGLSLHAGGFTSLLSASRLLRASDAAARVY